LKRWVNTYYGLITL